MNPSVELSSLCVRFGEVVAVDDLTTTLHTGAVTGLLGRNGAGKSTLLATVAGYRRPSSGEVRVGGEQPYEHPQVMSATCLVRDAGDLDQGMTVDGVFEVARELRRSWDQDFADRLVDRFELPRTTKVGALSRGKQSALLATVGLATRAPLTMFDEPQLGMDPPTRYTFYEELLADYAAHPRTIVISTHLVDESAALFEHVLVLDRGRLVLHQPVDQLAGRGVELTGPAEAVDALVAGLPTSHERTLGRTKSVVVLEPADGLTTAASAAGVEVGPLALQDLFVHLTSEEARR